MALVKTYLSKHTGLEIDTAVDDVSVLQTQMLNKVDKVEGKQLSTNDFTNELLQKLNGIEAGAQVNVQADWSESNEDSPAYIKNKPTIPEVPVKSVAGKTGDVELVKADVGLGNVDNTSDLNKPISNATQAALDLKANQTALDATNAAVAAAQSTADTAKSIAEGRSQAKVFATKEAMDEWLEDEDNVATLNVGDNLYIEALDVPDYWWDGSEAKVLEVEKVDLSDYYTKSQVYNKTEIDGFLSNKADNSTVNGINSRLQALEALLSSDDYELMFIKKPAAAPAE